MIKIEGCYYLFVNNYYFKIVNVSKGNTREVLL